MREFLPVEEAAKLARCDQRKIRRTIREGELEAFFSSGWLLAVYGVPGIHRKVLLTAVAPWAMSELGCCSC